MSSEDYIFGGYNALNWNRSSSSIHHPDMFLFTLINPHNIPPTKYKIKPQGKGFIYSAKCSIVFGRGYHDIFISSPNEVDSETNFPCEYIDTTGKGNSTFTGSKKFRVKEIEVYQVTFK